MSYADKERRKINEVQDKSAELWIKVIGLVAVITFPLIGVIGTLALRSLDEINRNIAKMQDTISQLSIGYKTIETRLDILSSDSKDHTINIQSNTQRIIKLEGKRQ